MSPLSFGAREEKKSCTEKNEQNGEAARLEGRPVICMRLAEFSRYDIDF